MNGQEAKSRVWAHWEYLRRLCERQFPGDANLGEEAFNHLLDTLNENDWVRLRTWEEQGEFKTFLTVVAKRLLIDFRRKRLGYQRPPKWLREEIARENEGIEQRPMNDAGASRVSLWQLAYRSLYRDKYSRQEVVEKLLTQEPNRERRLAVEMVATILARCPAPIASPDASQQSLDALQDRETGPIRWRIISIRSSAGLKRGRARYWAKGFPARINSLRNSCDGSRKRFA